MKDLFYLGLKILVIFIIAVVLINDGGALVMTYLGASDLAQTVANGAVSSYKASHSSDAAKIAAEGIAEHRGLKLTGFYMDNRAITVNVEVPPRRTFIVHRIKSLKSYLSASVTASADIESPVD